MYGHRAGAGLLAATVLCAPVRAEPPEQAPVDGNAVPATRAAAVATALAGRPSLAATAATVDEADAAIRAAEAAWYPGADVTASLTNGLSGSYGALDLHGLAASPVKSLFGASLNVWWTAYDFGRRANVIDAAVLDRRVAELRGAVEREAVALGVMATWDRCVRLDREALAAGSLVRARALSAERASALAEAGLRSAVDAGIAAVRLSQARRDQQERQADARACRVELSRVVGSDLPQAPLEPAATTDDALPGAALAVEDALSRRPEVALLEARAEAAGQRADAAFTEYLPSIRVTGSVGWARVSDGVDAAFGDPPFYAVGLGVEVPVFDGLLTGATVDRHQAEAAMWRASLDELRLALRAQALAALDEARVAREVLPVAKDEVTQSRALLEQARAHYDAQLASLVELGEAEAAVARAEVAVARAEERASAAAVRLAWARGRLLAGAEATAPMPPLPPIPVEAP